MHRVPWVLQAFGILLAASGPASAQFVPASNPPFPVQAGQSPVSVVVGNFNGDSIPDLAVANLNDGTVTVILSDGKGGFTAGSAIPVGQNPISIATADLNKDGNPDLVVANESDGTVTVLLGDGTGGFKRAAGSPFQVGTHPSSVAVGDFNGDGYPDLAIANRDSNNVTVLLSDGRGGFNPAPHSPFAVGTRPSSLAVGDFNGDGHPDLAIANELDNTVTVLLGDGTGNFNRATASPFAVGLNPTFVAVGDFNTDGNLDLAVTNLSGNNVTVLLGNGTGWFKADPAGPFAAGSAPVSIAVSDFNGDSIPDLAISNSGSNNVTVLLGDGAGGFKAAPGSPYATGSTGNEPYSIAVGDFNGDGKLDLAIANLASGNVTVLLNAFTTTPAMVSAASYAAAGPVAPGSMVSVFGTGLAASATSSIALPTCLDGIGVTLTDFSGAKNPLLLLYAGPAQINAEIPQNAATGAASFTISPSTACPGAVAGGPPTGPQKGSVTVAAVAPALFSENATGKGVAAAYLVTGGIQTAAFDCTETPCVTAPLIVSGGDSILELYGTGIQNRAKLSDVTVTVGSQALPALYAGPAPGSPGEDQVNVALPASLAGSKTVFVTVSVAGTVSNAVTLLIQ